MPVSAQNTLMEMVLTAEMRGKNVQAKVACVSADRQRVYNLGIGLCHFLVNVMEVLYLEYRHTKKKKTS